MRQGALTGVAPLVALTKMWPAACFVRSRTFCSHVTALLGAILAIRPSFLLSNQRCEALRPPTVDLRLQPGLLPLKEIRWLHVHLCFVLMSSFVPTLQHRAAQHSARQTILQRAKRPACQLHRPPSNSALDATPAASNGAGPAMG